MTNYHRDDLADSSSVGEEEKGWLSLAWDILWPAACASGLGIAFLTVLNGGSLPWN